MQCKALFMSHVGHSQFKHICHDLSLPVLLLFYSYIYRMGLEANLHEVSGLSYEYGKGIMVMVNHIVCKRIWQLALNLS